MKITKGYLKKVILEELNRLEEGEDFQNVKIGNRFSLDAGENGLIQIKNVAVTLDDDGNIELIKINGETYNFEQIKHSIIPPGQLESAIMGSIKADREDSFAADRFDSLNSYPDGDY